MPTPLTLSSIVTIGTPLCPGTTTFPGATTYPTGGLDTADASSATSLSLAGISGSGLTLTPVT